MPPISFVEHRHVKVYETSLIHSAALRLCRASRELNGSDATLSADKGFFLLQIESWCYDWTGKTGTVLSATERQQVSAAVQRDQVRSGSATKHCGGSVYFSDTGGLFTIKPSFELRLPIPIMSRKHDNASRLRSYINRALKRASGRRVQMQYTRYLSLIFDKLRVDFDGWPSDILIQPPQLMELEDLQTLVELFAEGRLCMRRITKKEYEARRKMREENVLYPGPRQQRSDAGEPRVRTDPRTMKSRRYPKRVHSSKYVYDSD
ncbi:hypothetical protein NM688_g5910 [Phlebia brevispora]|uniref:Uncharacterized protein n=1 Tax=Phlebia brevispora TaxID=194682 RepID=A0ACC1SN73_9APHY|nr:hypothetical protein NM688_g5910 [Phlebia brevispora]